MDSEDSRDGSGDAQSSSSSSSSSSRSRRSSSSDRSTSFKKNEKVTNTHSPSSHGPRSPSPESKSQSSVPKKPSSPENLSEAHSDINSPENSMPASPTKVKGPKSPTCPSEPRSNIASPEHSDQYSSAPASPKEGAIQSPASSVKSGPASPDESSRPPSPESRSQIASPASSPPASPLKHSRPASLSPERVQRPPSRNDWSPKDTWRRKNKAEQKQTVPTIRSRSNSSQSSRSSSYNKRSDVKDTATEEISEGEMESDQEERKSPSKSINSEKIDNKEEGHLNLSHEDLSDVSDLDSVGNDDVEKENKHNSPAATNSVDNVRVNGNNGTSAQSSPKSDCGKFSETPKLDKLPHEKTSNTEDGEEQLDFEAEEGECVEPKSQENVDGEVEAKVPEKEEQRPGRTTRASSPEEGEVSDEAERRPEETEPRPVCRFYSRGACTWGISCRFLHPGVTDKGNYSMFDVVRGVPTHTPGYPPASRDPAPPESAWERGLRTAKEMLRIANKRKEQDMDFEEKKLHLSVGGVVHDPDAELAYAAAAVGASPPPSHHMEVPHREAEVYSRPYGPPMYGRPRFMGGRPPMDERERFYDRERYERERPYERPAYEDPTDEASYHKRRVRSSREVIVQRAEVERHQGREVREGREGREGRPREPRGDEWADPWMRTEPTRRRRPPSSDDSYSSSSSRSSRSPGARRKRRASSSSRQRLSPSVIVRERRQATARATAMNPPAPRRRAPSPAAARQHAANPPPPASHRHKDELDPYGRNKVGRNRKKYSKSSSSGSDSSSSSSESDSESRSSTSSGSSSEAAKRGRQARLFNAASRPRLNAKSTAGLAAAVSTVTSKKEVPGDKEMAKKRSATSPVDSGPAKKSVSRREELLKQLKAVEDAIARKRSKI